MSLSRAVMLERARARDKTYDGRFLTGVLSTGIYCLPSCPARTPRDDNVRHFADPVAARAAGLRPCRRCRPDDFYRGHDPDLELARRVAAAVRAAPGDFASGAGVAAWAGVGFTKLSALFRAHFHTTPAALLTRARVDAACTELLATRRRVLDVGLDAGFESSSAFHDNFRRYTGMAPGDYRRLGRADRFAVALPKGLRTGQLLAWHGRDPDSAGERLVDATTLQVALVLDRAPALLAVSVEGGHARCAVAGRSRPAPSTMAAAHRVVTRLFNLGGDPAGFERLAGGKLGHGRLLRGRRGSRVALTADPFACLVWAILGQQVNLAFAYALRRRLVRACGSPLPGTDLVAHPTPAQVARLDVADLLPLQVSRRKAEYLVDTARLLAGGGLDLDALATAPVPAVRQRLLAVRGLGPWSVDYLLMRGFGHADCVPLGDAGLTAALQRYFDLEARPDRAQTEALMRPFAPWRSLATHHLWQSLGDGDDRP